MADVSIRAIITADDKASAVLKGFSSSLDDAKVGSLALLGGLTALAGGAALTVKAFSESQDIATQLNAVLKSTAGVAGVTADAAIKLSKSLEASTTFSDEQVLSAENLLLTFTKIGKDIFPQSTEAVLNMATALGEDTKSAAIQLGKALQDPILGVTALRRVGVAFTKDQQDVIKNLVETGHQAEAQRLILKELDTEFGGSAKAAAGTFSGQLKQLYNTFNDLEEIIGGTIVKAISPFVKHVEEMIAKAGGAEGVMNKVTDAFKRLQPYLPVIIGAILGGLVPAFVALAGSVIAATLPLLPYLAIGAAIGLVFKDMGVTGKDVSRVFHIIGDEAKSAYDMVKLLVTGDFKGGVFGLSKNSKEIEFLLRFRNGLIDIKNVAVETASFVSRVLGEAFRIFQGVLTLMMPSIKAMNDSFRHDLLPSLEHIWESVTRLWQALNPALLDALKIIGLVIGAVLVGAIWLFINVTNIMTQVIAGVINFIGILVGWFANLVSWLGTAAVWVGRLIEKFLSIPGSLGVLAALIPQPFKTAFDAIAAFWNNTVGKLKWTVPKWVPDIGGQSLSAPQLPMLAEGGIVTRPTVAMIGEAGPEAVVPLKKAGLGNVNITIQAGAFMGNAVEARKFAEEIIGHINDIAGRKNTTGAKLLGA